MNGRIWHEADDGTRTDVSEGVQALYDLVIQSMDWGSGFLTEEDAEPVVRIATLCEFAQFEEAAAYVTKLKFSAEQDVFMQTRQHFGRPPEHDHVWSEVLPFRCLWRYCPESYRERPPAAVNPSP